MAWGPFHPSCGNCCMQPRLYNIPERLPLRTPISARARDGALARDRRKLGARGRLTVCGPVPAAQGGSREIVYLPLRTYIRARGERPCPGEGRRRARDIGRSTGRTGETQGGREKLRTASETANDFLKIAQPLSRSLPTRWTHEIAPQATDDARQCGCGSRPTHRVV
jgi:hypothetical protein